MKMSGELAISESANGVAAGKLGRRQVIEIVWALVCPPLLALATVILMLGWLESVEGFRSFRGNSQLLLTLNVTGSVLLSAVILLDLRAFERLSAIGAANVRLALHVSALVSLVFLVVWVTTEAGRDNTSYSGEIVMFICLPTLFVCAPLLWFSARAIERTSLRVLLLALFVMATVWVEWQCQTENRSSTEESVLMFNSLLVALAFAIRLCVWGATEYRKAEGARS